MITAQTKLCMVIGHPVSHSLSPLIHNAGYQALGIDGEFVYVACDVDPESIAEFVTGIRVMGVRGVSCTIPHKEIILPHLDEVDSIAKQIGAVNTVVQEKGVLRGYNTDWMGALVPLKTTTPLKGKKVAVIGAGGAARAMVYGLVREGAVVTVYNRTLEKAQELAQTFGCEAAPLTDYDAIKAADIICNTTSVGMYPHEEQTPLPGDLLRSEHIVFDAVYAPYETKLLRDAKAKGAHVIHGTDMFLAQAMAQFKLYTGHDAPEKAMRTALMKGIKS